jgi:tripartite-type tricarboxylate transporter receptor subunit TctC
VAELAAGLKAHVPPARLLRRLAGIVVYPVVISLVAIWAAPLKLPLLLQALLTLALVTPFGPLIYRLAYQSLADASVLVLLIVSVGVHFALLGLGLFFFGAEGFRNPSFWDTRFTMGPLTLTVWSIAQYLYARLPFETDRDFQPVSLHWELPNVLVVSAAHTPARTAQEFVSFAKGRSNGASYGSPGVGTTAHLCGSLFTARNGIDGVHVPFRGAAQIIPAMLSGDVTFAIDNLASYVPVIQEGRMRALAVTSAARHPALPDVPTMAEAGIENFTVQSWCAFGMPAGVPAPIVARASALMQQVANEPATKERFLRTGAHAIGSSPDGVWERARRERPLWQEMVRISGARLE